HAPQAPRLDHEGGAATRAPRRRPRRHPHAAEDGLPRARRALAAGPVLGCGRGVRGRAPRPRSRPALPGRRAPPRRRSSRGPGRAWVAALAAREPRDLAPHTPRWRRHGRGHASGLRPRLSPDPVDLVKMRVPALRAATRARARAGAFDLCVADFLHSMPNVPTDRGLPVLLFEHNVEHLIWKRLADIDTQAWRRTLL